MKLAIAQLSPVIGDFDGNEAAIAAAIRASAEAGARLLVTPELSVCGYPPKDLLYREDFLRRSERAVAALAAATAGVDVVVIVGAPMRVEGRLFNAACVLHRGAVAAVVPKVLLPTYDIFDELRWFAPGRNPGPVRVGGLVLGVTVCEDLWCDEVHPGNPSGPACAYPVDPFDALVGCDVIVNLSASPFHVGKSDVRLRMLRTRAAQAAAPIVYVNQVGGNDELLFDGESWVIAPDGAVIDQAPAWEPGLRMVDLASRVSPRRESGEAQLHRALVCGIRDYAARTGIREAILGLSGGVDSALVAALACEALGPSNVLGVGMPGPYSSPGSVTDARALAATLGMPFELVPITGIQDAFLGALAPIFAGRPANVAEENLQARARGSVLMAISNKSGQLLLNTGNKSEMAVGYCTLYGDMNGGLAVLGDVYKTEVYGLCAHIDSLRPTFPAATLTKPPSAELRPNQTDQDSLPPYPLLDPVLRGLVEAEASPDELVASGFDAELVARVSRMVARAEFKRWQAPPILRVSRRAFGSGRRLPLATRWT